MYLKQQKRANGDIYLSIMEKYFVPKTGAREKTIEGLGCISELKKKYDDPVAYFTQYAKKLTEQKKKEKSVNITIDSTAKMSTDTNDAKNVGYGVLKELYRQLELDKFWNWKTRNLSVEFNVDKIFRLLVFSRILCPASKKGTFDHKGFYFEDFGDFSLDDVYHALDVICDNNEALQQWIFEHSGQICARDLSVSYFDCTNYYFDIGRSDLDILDDDGNPADRKGNAAAPQIQKTRPRKEPPSRSHRGNGASYGQERYPSRI